METRGPASTRAGSGPAEGARVTEPLPTSLSLPLPLSVWSPCGLSCWWPQGDQDSSIGMSGSQGVSHGREVTGKDTQ